MADPATKKVLQELVNTDSLNNKTCVDCGAPRPQWASISFAVFICLQCAGAHRGFGVHISFVRSISMDTWQEEQLRRMKLGGNAPFTKFLQEYPTDQGGYTESMSTHDKYHCWAATQYREKLTAALEDRPWQPSVPPPSSDGNFSGGPGRPSSAQGLRKSRTLARSPASNLSRGSNSPARTPSSVDSGEDRKTANENFFASLGASNASRPSDIPPSQGGRYTGFGSTPSPEPLDQLSSSAVPTLGELQSDPVRAFSKGWSLFAGAVAGASRTVNESVIRPGMERVTDPELREKVSGYVSSASQHAASAAGTANAWGRAQFGIDVGESVGAVVDKVRTGVTGGPRGDGYEVVDRWGGDDGEEQGSALYADAHEDDFFKENNGNWNDSDTPHSEPSKVDAKLKAGSDNWDDWKDF